MSAVVIHLFSISDEFLRGFGHNGCRSFLLGRDAVLSLDVIVLLLVLEVVSFWQVRWQATRRLLLRGGLGSCFDDLPLLGQLRIGLVVVKSDRGAKFCMVIVLAI